MGKVIRRCWCVYGLADPGDGLPPAESLAFSPALRIHLPATYQSLRWHDIEDGTGGDDDGSGQRAAENVGERNMLFASDFGQIVPWWFYVLFALLALLVATASIVAVVGVLAALFRIVGRLLTGGTRKPSSGRDSDRTR
jgi:hypothetical protein